MRELGNDDVYNPDSQINQQVANVVRAAKLLKTGEFVEELRNSREANQDINANRIAIDRDQKRIEVRKEYMSQDIGKDEGR